ncbi:3-oxoacyl-[acyl-carrier-protein] synthase I [Tistlia consotensis]|uniref:3-oxoacyl-[acyl-carrier-protein] synthase 1 n=1 Tax=Tistlia consotensis USBA 355 TaxID=560819 RepID=A0A1Y6CLR5_9PROT|nr:beta-ketoacyl-ACP synthase I [Tistlia consotensis]SMF74645.1 3-oxoacyl-[acyl-carrier-protein] synthase I [Tistlia consotensis USBA 355]SNS11009.1 3-oxoacyl-[acyl-carrier-protein] synthase I [Tistlia consotensis]
MRRVAVTGLGIVSSIGSNKEEVAASLRAGRSGIVFAEDYAERGFRSHVKGQPQIDLDAHIDRRLRRFMGDGAAYNYVAMVEAIADAGLDEKEVSHERTGLIVGSGGPSTSNQVEAADIAREKGVKRIGPYMVPRCMSSTNSANLATAFKIKGHSYSISSACSTSAHCIGNGSELIQYGKQDIVFAGGGEELHWTLSMLFDAMGALSSHFNDQPTKASRAYDKARDGFVIAGGGGVVVLEEMERAKARGARIYGEVVGYGATSDGADMVAPSADGQIRVMRMALSQLGNARVDYINTHGTSTPVGDGIELQAIKEVFGQDVPRISSTKSMTGHAQGAAGATEAIYSLLMMERGFIAPSINIDEPDDLAAGIPIPRVAEEAKLDCVLSNSFGFGGTNCSLAFRRVED